VPLNPPSGNMYPWAWTWNPIGGECKHRCIYCYVPNKIAPWLLRMGNPKYYGRPRLIENELQTSLKKPNDGKVIFVQSNGDLFGYWIPKDWISRVLAHCRAYPQNTYLYQSKNPYRFLEHIDAFPKNTILGSTLETNRNYRVTKAPSPEVRYTTILHINSIIQMRWMISIEPIMDFDLETLIQWIRTIGPEFVSIGADSGNNNLPEPNPQKINTLINKLEKITEVRIKKNLNRLIK